MPPQQGMFSVRREDVYPPVNRKRKELASKLGKEIVERRDDGRHYNETVSALHSSYIQLCTRPSTYPGYALRLYPLSLERSALLAQIDGEERYALDGAQTAYEEERERVEEEFKRGRERVRERLIEGIEERRRRARDEKEGEGIIGDSSIDSQSRPHITRKLRNKVGSPSPAPLLALAPATSTPTNATTTSSTTSATSFLNPLSLSVDELPSPFPLPLTATSAEPPLPPYAVAAAPGTTGGAGGPRRKPKGGGANSGGAQLGGGLGKSLLMLATSKESEIEADLGEIRRGSKRRRAK